MKSGQVWDCWISWHIANSDHTVCSLISIFLALTSFGWIGGLALYNVSRLTHWLLFSVSGCYSSLSFLIGDHVLSTQIDWISSWLMGVSGKLFPLKVRASRGYGPSMVASRFWSGPGLKKCYSRRWLLRSLCGGEVRITTSLSLLRSDLESATSWLTCETLAVIAVILTSPMSFTTSMWT